jgi:hypothetical protein
MRRRRRERRFSKVIFTQKPLNTSNLLTVLQTQQQTTKKTSPGTTTMKTKTKTNPRQRLRPHHKTLPTKLLPAPPLLHNPQQQPPATLSRSSHLGEARKRKQRAWRTLIPAMISCLVRRVGRRVVQRTRRRMLRRRIAMTIGSRREMII